MDIHWHNIREKSAIEIEADAIAFLANSYSGGEHHELWARMRVLTGYIKQLRNAVKK